MGGDSGLIPDGGDGGTVGPSAGGGGGSTAGGGATASGGSNASGALSTGGGAPAPDASVEPTPKAGDDGGCSCRVPSTSRSTRVPAAALLLAFAVGRRCMRRHARGGANVLDRKQGRRRARYLA
jgi:MYXO-CTERM domain-containing protein